MRPFELTLCAAAEAIARGELSPVELTDSVLERCAAVEGQLNAYVTVVVDHARAAAAQAQREIRSGQRLGPLHGIPYGLKDLIDTAGITTTASSRLWEGRVPSADSTVAALLSAAGAVLVGKTHTHEFAYGLLTPQTANPWAARHIAGGSSGGSAVAVAAGSALFALGTDTGGSIRVPASLNGVVGLKPTYGLISRHGVAPLSWSLDHVGPLTRTVEDAALVLEALAHHDPRDGASIAAPRAGSWPRSANDGLRGLRIGVPVNYYFDRVDPQVASAVHGAVAHLEKLGADLVEVRLPLVAYVEATQWGLMAPEASAVHEATLGRSAGLYSPDVRLLLEAGGRLPALDYLRAQRSRALIRNAWLRLFEDVDVIAAPSAPLTAALCGQTLVHWPDGTDETVTDAYVRLSAPANITGFPALSVPAGQDADGLPIGMQLIASPLAESVLFRVGVAFERSRGAAGTLAPVG